MRVMDRPSRVLGSRAQATSKPERHFLDPVEIRLITDGKLERLAEFAASSRLHAADPKGDTPLHLAARMGNLTLCDLFIRSGADPVLDSNCFQFGYHADHLARFTIDPHGLSNGIIALKEIQ